ncbi:MAG: hypothetical protein B0D92_01015 [Spirochaeta sp. LUC14_002_19_P3]|nr:MAG: hypothetical protein B0D92_01015 [Spirochaeta sp. LUC14_002_19_P3]
MIKLFINKHMAVFSLSVMIVILGVIAYIRLPRETQPDVKIPYIIVTTTYTGVSAGDIESLITDPIESELEGMNGLNELTSESRQNISVITAEFSADVETEEALRRTKDRVDIAAAELPADAGEPNVREVNVSDWPIFSVVLSHPDGVEAITTAAEELRDDLNQLIGVQEVTITGNAEKELAIELDPYQMSLYSLSVDDVKNAVNQEHVTIPGGILNNQEKNYTIAITGEITEPYRFNDIMVKGTGASVPLGKIARVSFQDAKRQTISRLNGEPAITLNIKKRIGENILKLAEAAHARIEELTPALPKGTIVNITYDESIFIREMIADLENNMFSGFVLVLAVTIFFLGFRNSLFVSMAIPLSMLMSFFILQLLGITLNMIVLFSLIIALGMLVDNGIVIVENIYRHQSMGKSRVQAAIDGTGEVAAPIIASTITTLLAFFPIIFMPGILGEFMSYLPKTVIVVLASSLFVALAINPTYCASFLKAKHDMESGGKVFTSIQNWYTRLIERTTAHGILTVVLMTLLVTGGFVAYGVFKAEVIFFPDSDPDRVRISLEAPQGTPIEHTDRYIRQVEKAVPGIPMSIDSFEATSGQSSGDTESSRGEVLINFLPYADRDIPSTETIQSLRNTINPLITGAIVTIRQSATGPPSGDDISYEIRGSDYRILGAIANDIVEILNPYQKEFKLIDNDYNANLPEIAVNIDRQKAAYYGLNTAQAAATIRTAITGSKINTFRYRDEEYDINLRYRDDARDSLQMLRGINIITPNRRSIPLSAIAEIVPQSSLNIIKRRGLHRAVAVNANFTPGNENRSRVNAEVSAKVNTLKTTLPPGYTIGSGAGSDIRAESTTFLIQAFIIAVFLIGIVLIAQFNSLIDPIIIIYGVFLSIGGVMWGFALGGLFVKQNFVVIMSGIGSIALAGVAVNNCIVLVDYTHKLIHNNIPWHEAIVLAGKTRLRPVILTALTTILALIPMALGVSFDIRSFQFVVGSESAEFWKAFAWTMLYGLTFATLSTLIVVPSMLSIKYRIVERWKGKVQ